MDNTSLAATVLSLTVALSPIAAAKAAELKVIAGGSMTASLRELGPRFEKVTGHKLDMTFAATPELIKMATSGQFDLGVVPVDVMKNDAVRGKFAGTPAGSRQRVQGQGCDAGISQTGAHRQRERLDQILRFQHA
ncbi:MAG TPA: substrate-binding domain-containing protein [Pseudolabrys sp.]